MELLIFNINDFTPELYDCALSMLSAEKRTKIDKMKDSEQKKRSLAGDFLARTLISKASGLSPAEVVIETGENGKPVTPIPGISFSIAHSGIFALCAVGGGYRIGADIERLGRKHPPVPHFFTQPELDYVNSGSETRFFELWTLKEAYAKATGKGIFSSDGKKEFIENGKLQLTYSNMRFRLYDILNGYLIAVCELYDSNM